MSNFTNNFLKKRSDKTKVILEGFHPVKHAIRFQAQIEFLYCYNKQLVLDLAEQKSPDIIDFLNTKLIEISIDEYNKLSPKPPKTGIIGIAEKPEYDISDVLNKNGNIVFLEQVRSLDNLGAVIRVCAARGIDAVFCSGDIDPFHPTCLRASRGLHFAIPVIKVDNLPRSSKQIIVFDENGSDYKDQDYSQNSILVFGSERAGVSNELKNEANKTLSIPMQNGVSSLNLATSVAISVYKN